MDGLPLDSSTARFSQCLLHSSRYIAALQPAWSGLEQFLARPHPGLLGGGAPAPRNVPLACARGTFWGDPGRGGQEGGAGRAGNCSHPLQMSWSVATHLLSDDRRWLT
eukprot:12918315-Alexandrium_andersonii.AAC.1